MLFKNYPGTTTQVIPKGKVSLKKTLSQKNPKIISLPSFLSFPFFSLSETKREEKMGNNSKTSSLKKKKKKGRPSLLDLQKRKQQQQEEEEEEEEEEEYEEEEEEEIPTLKRKRRNSNNSDPDPPNSDNPYLKFSSGRRSTRRNPNPSDEDEEDDEEEEERAGRKEKKLRLVLDAAADSPEHNDMRGKRVNSNSKGTHGNTEPSGSGGPTTPLPDKKLLGFILDKLQKKDTYEVFKEPVDPEELPDYHDIIEHPMDFQTVRKKLKNGDYANLEQLESDVLLICSNAMSYNSSDTIYYRQARTIQEMAKKDFANLRSDEPKPVPRRGRPPGRPPGKKPSAADRVTNQDAAPADVAGPSGRGLPLFGMDLLRRGPQSLGAGDFMRGMLGSSGYNWLQHRNDGFSGFGSKMNWLNGAKKPVEIEESSRSTYKYPLSYHSYQDPPLFNSFDDYHKILIPVGIQNEHAYSRSLARFASQLGPTAWRIASERINQALPPGTPFGPGWVGESDAASSAPANPSPQPATPTAAPDRQTADLQQGVVVPKLNMHFQMHACGSLNGFGNSDNNNNISGGVLRNGDLGLNLNLGFQSPVQSGSSPRIVEQKQQPDLALQL
ncbi:hypothetical protein LUZ60_011972 [Juncus effusus]|nr:hypothetical protein LUZ60_011972 [Juncus effusus]